MNANQNPPSPAAAHAIRLALLTGVLLFGAVSWYVNRSATAPRIDVAANAPFRIAFYAVLLGSIAGVYIVRGMRARAAGFAQRINLTIVAWAIAEGAALFGGVIYLLTQDPVPYLCGLILFVGALATVGIPEDDRVRNGG
jgi:predicted MFS family arabinose efflux permease